MREVMLATRELNIDRLPESSRNWINEKLIYTHGYGITMNPVNGFTPEGLPTLILSNMPIQSERRQPFRGEAIHRVHGNTVAVRIDKLFVDPVAAALREPIDVQLACGKHYLTHGVVDLIPINVDVGKIVVAADLLNLA